MNFIKSADSKGGSEQLTKQLMSALSAKNKVLWIVSGGSNIRVECEVMAKIPNDLRPFLAIVLVDERFGEIGHKDSNAQQLLDSGFEPDHANFIPILTKLKSTPEDTAKHYQFVFEQAVDFADVVIAELGIGWGGHIGGILPDSPALTDKKLVISYQAADYQRISLTSGALVYINSTYVFSFGPDKAAELKRLKDEKVAPAKQPAQLLKTMRDVRIYNDYVEGEAL